MSRHAQLLMFVVAAASGFISLSYEILWYRVIAFGSWGLPSAFGMLLAAYLFGLAIGSKVSGWFCKDGTETGDGRQLRPLVWFVFLSNAVAWLVAPAFAWSAKITDWRLPLVVVAVAAALLGAILPLVAHFGIAPDDRAGQKLSYVYLANIVGAASGSLITGFVFMDRWPIATIGLVLALLGVGLTAIIAGFSVTGVKGRAVSAALLGAAVLTLFATNGKAYDRIYERLLFKGKLEPDTRFAEVIETKSGVITVTEDGTVYGGGAYDGRFNTSIKWDRNGIMRAYGIGAMHPAPRKVLMIGLASGSWATVVEHLPGVESLTIVEINPGYMKLIAGHDEVKGLLTDPKVHLQVDDGRRWLHRHPDERFDVIVMNTTWHWRAHITNLLSVEFMELARAHMEPGGIFYFNTTSSDDVQKTAATVFPHALRVYNFIAVSDSPLTFDKARWHKVLSTFAIAGEPAVDRSTEDGQQLFNELYAYADTIRAAPVAQGLEARDSVLARTQGARVVTDDNMVPEWREVFRFQDPP